VLFENRCRFLQAMLEPLGGFQFLEVLRPLALPVQGEPAQAQNGNAQTHQAAIGHAMQIAQQWRLLISPPRGQGTLNQLQGSCRGSPLSLLALLNGNGDHDGAAELRK
jgi:hypothetical protein